MERRPTGVRNVTCGENVTLYEPCNLYDCVLGNGVFIGPFVEIQGNTRIGDEQNSVPHLHLRVRHHGRALFHWPWGDVCQRYVSRWQTNADRNSWGRITVGNDVSIGSRATIRRSPSATGW